MASTTNAKGRVMRLFRTIHAWLGIFIFPWIVIIGATGLFLNHAKPFLAVLEGPSYPESRFDDWPAAETVSLQSATAIATSVWPSEPIQNVEEKVYHDRPSFDFKKTSGHVIVTQPTGHYFVKTSYRRETFAPNGELLHSKIYWGALFKGLHRRGWLGRDLGTWMADITSVAMVVFGLTGAVIWWTTRSRRLGRSIRGLVARKAEG